MLSVLSKVDRIAAGLWQSELYSLERLRRFFNWEDLPAGFELIPECHPSYDPASAQVFPPPPPPMAVRRRLWPSCL